MLIYKITNLITGRIYIGQTNNRQRSYMGSGKVIKLAIKKYGKENFKKETVVEGDFNRELTDALEKHYIRLYNSNNKKVGYNLDGGGRKNRVFKMSEEGKRKIGLSKIGNTNRRGKKASIETRLKLSISHIGKKQPKEQIDKRKASRKITFEKTEYVYRPRFYARKSIKCININTQEEKLFESITIAASMLNLKRTAINNNLKNMCKLVNKQYKFYYHA